MYVINSNVISYSWENDELISLVESRFATLASIFPNEELEKLMLTKYDTIFLESEIERSIVKLFAFFVKYSIAVADTLFYNKENSSSIKESGVSISQRLDSENSMLYSAIVIESIDYLSFQYIVDSIILAWAKANNLKEIESDMESKSERYLVEILAQIIQLKRPHYSQSYTTN